MVLPLSPGLRCTLGALGRRILHLSPILVSHPCLPLLVLWAAWFIYACFPISFHSGCSGPRNSTLISHLFSTLGALDRILLHLFPTYFPHLSPSLGALGRILLHLSPTCFPNNFTCMGFLFFSKGCILGPHDFAFISRLAFHFGYSTPHNFPFIHHLLPAMVANLDTLGHKILLFLKKKIHSRYSRSHIILYLFPI